eukprot:2475781-Amphidinium_carterae.2
MRFAIASIGNDILPGDLVHSLLSCPQILQQVQKKHKFNPAFRSSAPTGAPRAHKTMETANAEIKAKDPRKPEDCPKVTKKPIPMKGSQLWIQRKPDNWIQLLTLCLQCGFHAVQCAALKASGFECASTCCQQ